MMISLPDLQVLQITGADAVNFAQAQFSSDVRSLANGRWQWSTWLSPQGRVRAFFHLLRAEEERLRLLLRGGSAETLRAALAPYVLRAKVVLTVDHARVGGAYEPAAHGLELPGSPVRWLVPDAMATADIEDSAAARAQWQLDDIRAGLPVLAAELQDQLLPQWLGLDRLGAVSVNKGCYPGQEVMSRLHFKGGNKRSLYRMRLESTCAPGTALLTDTGEPAGQVIQSVRSEDCGVEALASINDAIAAAPASNFAILQHFG